MTREKFYHHKTCKLNDSSFSNLLIFENYFQRDFFPFLYGSTKLKVIESLMKTVNYLRNDLTELSTSYSTMPDKRIKMTDNIYNTHALCFSYKMAKWTEFVLEEHSLL